MYDELEKMRMGVALVPSQHLLDWIHESAESLSG
jgi:hypothetical protein